MHSSVYIYIYATGRCVFSTIALNDHLARASSLLLHVQLGSVACDEVQQETVRSTKKDPFDVAYIGDKGSC